MGDLVARAIADGRRMRRRIRVARLVVLGAVLAALALFLCL
ncbi:hypothetical protein Val02_37500 [Virgisporangium aliadipatigenens]|uniref:Uncharacterized protein n=2 Tax=Virgisporangium aliadipatigenens TaxID=741659 RepID=A0A8J3YK76_9ACTN|nr:hypothetical protein Val02_37500 [Virgisporangium aliadipatigenens]